MIRKITVDQLRPGMRVAQLEGEVWMSHPLAYTKVGLIDSWDEVRSIRDAGFAFTFISEEDGHPSLRGDVALADEIGQARAIYAEAIGVAHHLFVRAARGKRLDVEPSRRAVESIGDSVSRNPEALHCLARMNPLEGHLATHSVNVAVICMAFGAYLGLPGDEVRELGLAGMLHDIGKAKVPANILEKPGKLTQAEYRVLKAHPMHSLSLMHGREGISKKLRQGVIEHHERHDGRGYPLGLGGGSITPFARYISLADTFDALTSKRTYKDAMVPSKALSLMYQQRGTQFAPADVDQFIKCLGVYPTGSLVRLTDGRTAVVYETNPDCPLSPIVNVVLDCNCTPMEPQVENLALTLCGETCRPVEIVAALDPASTGLDLSRLLPC